MTVLKVCHSLTHFQRCHENQQRIQRSQPPGNSQRAEGLTSMALGGRGQETLATAKPKPLLSLPLSHSMQPSCKQQPSPNKKIKCPDLANIPG